VDVEPGLSVAKIAAVELGPPTMDSDVERQDSCVTRDYRVSVPEAVIVALTRRSSPIEEIVTMR
jgi:hypothetical protein